MSGNMVTTPTFSVGSTFQVQEGHIGHRSANVARIDEQNIIFLQLPRRARGSISSTSGAALVCPGLVGQLLVGYGSMQVISIGWPPAAFACRRQAAIVGGYAGTDLEMTARL